MTEKVIRLLIVDEDKCGNRALAQILENNPEFEIPGIFETGKEALASCKSLVPDVIITGAKLGGYAECGIQQSYYPSLPIYRHCSVFLCGRYCWIEPLPARD